MDMPAIMIIVLFITLATFSFVPSAWSQTPSSSAGGIDFSDPETFQQLQNLLNDFNTNISEQLSDPSSSIAQPIEIITEPKHPQPEEPFVASINDYSSALQGSYVSWTVNDVPLPGSENKRKVNLVAGSVGENKTIKVHFLTPAGKKVTYQKEIKPRYLDIIIEPQTRVPDFYQGRALPSHGSTVNATAVVDGQLNEAEDLVYQWKLNQNPISRPIRGSNQISFTLPHGREVRLSVDVMKPGGDVFVSRFINIPSVRPTLYFYEANPLYGVSDLAIAKDYLFFGNSATLRAEPYHLDIQVYNQPDLIEWEVNRDKIINSSANPYEIVLQKNGTTASVPVNFHVRSLSVLLQGAERSINLKL